MAMVRKARWLVWWGYVVLWTTALLLPLETIEKLPASDLLGSYRYLFAKSLHVAAYAMMAILCGWLHLPARLRWIMVYFLIGHATLTEVLQKYVIPGRIGLLEDVAIDQVGITIGLVLSCKWWMQKDEGY
jgi:VanZ family protein